MAETRIPCKICERMILESTASHNDGLCGQCVKDPESALRDRRIKDTLISWGEASCVTYAEQLELAIRGSVASAIERYGRDGLGAILLYGIAHVDSPELIAVSNDQLSTLGTVWENGPNWDGLGERMEEELYWSLYEYRCDVQDECDSWSIAGGILAKLRAENVVSEQTFLCLVDEGMGYDEFIEIASKSNPSELLGLHSKWTYNPY